MSVLPSEFSDDIFWFLDHTINASSWRDISCIQGSHPILKVLEKYSEGPIPRELVYAKRQFFQKHGSIRLMRVCAATNNAVITYAHTTDHGGLVIM
ncbi:hypothetical protein QQ045_026347 [Rhodiola kirilowii]